MELYAAKGTIAVAAALTLEEAGADWTLNLVDFSKGDQTSAAYTAINPKGRVPALVVGDDILTETGAIMNYIADMHPQAGLIPTDPIRAGRMRELMFYLASTMHVNHAHKMRGHRWADQKSSHADMAAKVAETMTDSCAYVEEFIEGPFVLGDAISLADLNLFAVSRWVEGDGVDMTAFPKLSAFRETVYKRASVAAITAKGLL